MGIRGLFKNLKTCFCRGKQNLNDSSNNRIKSHDTDYLYIDFNYIVHFSYELVILKLNDLLEILNKKEKENIKYDTINDMKTNSNLNLYNFFTDIDSDIFDDLQYSTPIEYNTSHILQLNRLMQNKQIFMKIIYETIRIKNNKYYYRCDNEI